MLKLIGELASVVMDYVSVVMKSEDVVGMTFVVLKFVTAGRIF